MRAWCLFTLGWFAATIVSCGVLQSQSHPPAKIIPISGFEKIAGKWEGLSKRLPDMDFGRCHLDTIQIEKHRIESIPGDQIQFHRLFLC